MITFPFFQIARIDCDEPGNQGIPKSPRLKTKLIIIHSKNIDTSYFYIVCKIIMQSNQINYNYKEGMFDER